MSSRVRRGYASSKSASVAPSPSLRRISSTGIRVPRITGLPIMIFGLISIRSCAITSSSAMRSSVPILRDLATASIGPAGHVAGSSMTWRRRAWSLGSIPRQTAAPEQRRHILPSWALDAMRLGTSTGVAAPIEFMQGPRISPRRSGTIVCRCADGYGTYRGQPGLGWSGRNAGTAP